MKNYRKTYIKVHQQAITNNVKKVMEKYPYEYFMAVIKADCYGHTTKLALPPIVAAGVNYLCVSDLEEALEARTMTDLPILCFGVLYGEDVKVAQEKKITFTITSLENTINLLENGLNSSGIVHINIDSGMNRMGIGEKEELNETYKLLKQNNINIEGIYTHIYDQRNVESTQKQYAEFDRITEDIDVKGIKIRHCLASEPLVYQTPPAWANGCRPGCILYGTTEVPGIDFEPTFTLHSEIVFIKKIHKGERVGYDGIYTSDGEHTIGIMPIGYVDGLIRPNTGNTVYINDKPYKIIGKIAMDSTILLIDDSVKLHDRVDILSAPEQIIHFGEKYGMMETETMALFGKRIPRI